MNATNGQNDIGLENLFKDWQQLAMDSWSYTTRQIVSSDNYLSLMNASMDSYLAGMKKFQQSWELTLQALDLPQRADLARLSQQILAAETRTAEAEERLDQVQAELTETKERLQRLEAQLANASRIPTATVSLKTPKATSKSQTTSRRKK